MTSRRVLVVAHYYPPHLGGLEVVAKEVAGGLAARGVEVSVLTSACPGTPGRNREPVADVGPDASAAEPQVTVRRVPVWNPLEASLGVPFPIFSPSLAWHAWRMVRRADVVQINDMLYLSSWLVALSCLLQRTPYVLTQHVGLVHHPLAVVRWVQLAVHRTLGGLVLRGARRVLPISEFIESGTRDLFPQAQTMVLRNGADNLRYRPADPTEKRVLRAKYGLPADEVLVLYVGRFVPKKGFGLVSSCRADDYRLIYVGGDRPEGHPADDREIFLGRRPAEEVAELYRAADLFVSASVGECPMTVLEAMNSGLPVILNDEPGHRAGGVTGPGVRFVALTQESLSATLAELSADRAALAIEGAAARANAEVAFSWDHHLDVLSGVFDDVLAEEDSADAQVPGQVRRVAVVTPYYAPRIGGVEHYAARQVAALAAQPGVEPVVITTAEGWRTQVEQQGEVTVVRLGRWGVVSNTPLSPLWLWQLPRWLRRLGVDVVAAHSPVPGLADVAAYRAGSRPLVLTYHSGRLAKGSGPVDRLLEGYERWVLPRVFARASTLIGVSPVSLALRDPRARIISPGVDCETFVPTARPEAAGRLLYVGRLERASAWKGVSVLLAAFALVRQQVPDAELELVGSGDAVPDLQKQAADRGIADAIVWSGPLHGSDLVAAYQRCTALVLPSLTESESFGMTLIEAMACGRPVIGSRVGGIPHVVRDELDGLLVPPGDAGVLAAAALRLLGDADGAARMGAAGRVAAEEQWSWKARMPELVAACQEGRDR